MDTSAVRQKMRSRGTGALGPTLFEARKNGKAMVQRSVHA